MDSAIKKVFKYLAATIIVIAIYFVVFTTIAVLITYIQEPLQSVNTVIDISRLARIMFPFLIIFGVPALVKWHDARQHFKEARRAYDMGKPGAVYLSREKHDDTRYMGY